MENERKSSKIMKLNKFEFLYLEKEIFFSLVLLILSGGIFTWYLQEVLITRTTIVSSVAFVPLLHTPENLLTYCKEKRPSLISDKGQSKF